MITFQTDEGLDFKLKGIVKIRMWLRSVILDKGFKVGDLGYCFCSDEKILEVNRQFLQHDYYTDIITFDNVVRDIISGDMYISVETVRSNAEKYGVPFERELLRVIVHGPLHLMGFKDKTDEDAAVMRKHEDLALAMFDNLKRKMMQPLPE